MEIVDLLEYSERAQLREWFERNAAREKCCWIAMYRGKKKPEGVCLPGRIALFRMDRLNAQAVTGRTSGTTPLSAAEKEPLDRTE